MDPLPSLVASTPYPKVNMARNGSEDGPKPIWLELVLVFFSILGLWLVDMLFTKAINRAGSYLIRRRITSNYLPAFYTVNPAGAKTTRS